MPFCGPQTVLDAISLHGVTPEKRPWGSMDSLYIRFEEIQEEQIILGGLKVA